MVILHTSCNRDVCNNSIELQNQQLGITSAHNARQLGGYCISGKTIRRDVLLRSARLSKLSEGDSLILADKYKVQCIYDFRGQEESFASPDVIPGNARYMSLAISFGSTGGSASESETISMLLQYADNPLVQEMCDKMYDKIFLEEESHKVYRRFFADLMTIDPEEGAVLWHCTQGKDRAGAASAMLLAALGADRDLIMADFMLSKDYYEPHVAMVPVENDTQRYVINTLISANPDVFERTLDKIDAEYGSLRNYLTECIGVTPQMMKTLREKFLQ